MLSERLLTLLELPPLLRLSPPSLSALLELRLQVPRSRSSLAGASDRKAAGPGVAALAGEQVVLVPIDLEMTLSLWELGL